MLRKYFLIVFTWLLFLQYTKAQVNLQSGSATFSLPMFSWQDPRTRLSSSISLDYSSGSGFKVDEVASSVGQGWTLNAGGVVSRIQVGQPDDQKPRDGAIDDLTKYPPGYMYDPASINYGVPVAQTKYPIFEDKNHLYKQHNAVAADKEKDMFAFQMNGRSGLFVLMGKIVNGSYVDSGYVLGAPGLKVWLTRDENMPSVRTTINAFFIQNESGLIYKFTKCSYTKILKTGFCDYNQTEMLTQPKFKAGNVYHEGSFDKNDIVNPYVITGWYLTEVEDPLTHRKITFNYTTRNIDSPTGNDITYYDGTDYSIVSHKRTVSQTPALTSITYPDGHEVSFTYGAARFDLIGDVALSAVNIKYKGQYISRFQLKTSYFILNRYGIPQSDFQKSVARLCLVSVKKIGPYLKGDEQPYLFDYYMGSNVEDDVVPARFSLLKDIYGYYNGSNSKGANMDNIPVLSQVNNLNNDQLKGLCFLRNGQGVVTANLKTGYAKNGLLRQIVYPAGGATNYEYEQNLSVVAGVAQYVGGVHVSKTKVTDGGFSNGCNNPVVTNYNYVDQAGISSLWGLEVPDNHIVSYSRYEAELRQYKYSFPIGKCSYKYTYPGLLSREGKVAMTDWQKAMEAFSKVMNVVSVVSHVYDIVKFVSAPSIWGAAVIDIILDVVNLGITCFINPSPKEYTTSVYYNTDLNGANPLPVQFKAVEIVQGDGTLGKTVIEFTSDQDYALWATTNPLHSMKQRYSTAAYGLPKKTTLYDASGKIVKQTINNYDYSNAKSFIIPLYMPPSNFDSYKSVVKKTSSQRSSDWDDPSKYTALTTTSIPGEMDIERYTCYSSWVTLKESFERIYKLTDQSKYSETYTGYTYNYFVQTSQVRTVQSNGDTLIRNIEYSGDYIYSITDLGLGTLIGNHIFNEPVRTTTGIAKRNEREAPFLMIHETKTEFGLLANGNVKAIKLYERQLTQPTIPANAPALKLVKEFAYNGSDNIINVKDAGSHSIANIYSYDNRFVTATIVNADINVDKPAYTSFEAANDLGGWTSSNTVRVAGGITGDWSMQLDGQALATAGLNQSKAYKLSFWSASGTVNIDGSASLITSGPVKNGFTYYEYDLPTGTSSVYLSGTGKIDELRLYPKNARMQTATFEPIIGKTSTCDENNRITYYEYDELARMKYIRDEDKSIVKMFEYNVVSNEGKGCPSTYYSHGAKEIFTRNDCGAGYLGADVEYSVPAGKYTSVISQEDADNKMEAEFNRDGQANANANGVCRMIYKNTEQYQDFVKEGCAPGTKGSTVRYTVPAGKYSSLVDLSSANAKALEEIEANGQAYANATGACVYDVTPDWQAEEPQQTSCQQATDGGNTGHVLIKVKDVNPNSSSYGQEQWVDMGENVTACPVVNQCSTYRIEAPYTVTIGLYVQYKLCGASSTVRVPWSQLDVIDDPVNGRMVAILNLEGPPVFAYGQNSALVDMPEINVINIGNGE